MRLFPSLRRHTHLWRHAAIGSHPASQQIIRSRIFYVDLYMRSRIFTPIGSTTGMAVMSGASVINEGIARKVLQVVDVGLVNGVGNPIPGQMCVEAAVCYALGLPHGDDPGCVSPALRRLKIRLNDSRWSSTKARANGLRRLAVAQLGSKGELDEKEFVRLLVDYALRVSTPQALRSAASVHKDPVHQKALRDAANRCEVEASRGAALAARKTAAAYAADAAYAAAAAAYAAAAYAAAADDADAADAAYAARTRARARARDKALADYAEAVVQILIKLNAPGCQWLVLTEAA
ncbi:MAG: hypothetical protein IJ935_07275 [Afipia sp.]|nr:hypothetical protein [Afipia sp.]